MYGNQRVLYPMKRVGERGSEGKWERVSWDQAVYRNCRSSFIDHALEDGPESITFAMGTQMILKRASFGPHCSASPTSPGSWFRRLSPVSETCRLAPTRFLGYELPGDNMAAVFKSKCLPGLGLQPGSNAAFRMHTFSGRRATTAQKSWSSRRTSVPRLDARIQMAEPQARHRRSRWPWQCVHAIVEDGNIEWDYVREQTDLPFLVRTDNRKFLRLLGSSSRKPSAATRAFYHLG